MDNTQEVRAAKQKVGGDIVQRIQKTDSSGNEDETEHQQRPRLADAAKQIVKRDPQADEITGIQRSPMIQSRNILS